MAHSFVIQVVSWGGDLSVRGTTSDEVAIPDHFEKGLPPAVCDVVLPSFVRRSISTAVNDHNDGQEPNCENYAKGEAWKRVL